MTAAEVTAAVRAYRATAPRDFPVGTADRRLAARLRAAAAARPAVYAAAMRKGRW